MPTYTYRCEQCNQITEANQSMSENPLTHCIKCNGHINRIITSDIAIQFKGPGFYCTESNKKT